MRARSLNSIGVCFNHESENHSDEDESESHESSTVSMISRAFGSAASDLMERRARSDGRTTTAALSNQSSREFQGATIARATPLSGFMNPAQLAALKPSYPRTRKTDAAKLVAEKAGAMES
jgi:hypothetical protein